MAPLPPIDAALVPAEVRQAGPEAQKLYASALSFESMLTRQLAQSLTASLKSEDEESSDPASGIYGQMLPDAFAAGLTAAGGLGLAPQLYRALKDAS
jgi:Rod binding domain-containing protein